MAKYRVEREPVVQPQDKSIKLIALTKGQVTVVDAHNFERLNALAWNAYWHPRTKTFYARLGHSGQHMQRIIMNAKPGQLIDHHNGDTLDNRENNLRVATHAQNASNRKVHCNNKSGHKGVYWRDDMRAWQVSINCEGKRFHLGYFPKQEDAINARHKAERQHFGEFARPT
jgi:HNH endonuclease